MDRAPNYAPCEGRLQWLTDMVREWRQRKKLTTDWDSVVEKAESLSVQMHDVQHACSQLSDGTLTKIKKHLPAAMEYARMQDAPPDPAKEAKIPKVVKWLFWHLWRPRAVQTGASAEGDAIRALGRELADAAIRLFDLANSLGFNLEEYISWRMDRLERATDREARELQ